MKKRSKTNWERIDGLRDDQIDYSDSPALESDFFDTAIAWPGTKEQLTLRLSPEVLGFFRRQGKGYQTAIGRVLEDFVDKHKNPSADPELLLPFEIRSFSPEFAQYHRVKRNNFFASIQAFPHIWKACLLLDKIFMSEFADAETLRESKQLVPLLLLTQAHSQYRLAMELAFSSALTEAGSLLRQGVESTAFAHKLYQEPKLISVWLSKNEGKQQQSAYRKAFVENRKASLFSGGPLFEEMYSYWCDFSEVSSHTNMVGTLGRVATENQPTQVRWFLNYFEMDRRALGMGLFTLLHVAHLIESVVFEIFQARLQFDESLLRSRSLFEKYKEQVRTELKSEMGPEPMHEVLQHG